MRLILSVTSKFYGVSHRGILELLRSGRHITSVIRVSCSDTRFTNVILVVVVVVPLASFLLRVSVDVILI